MCRPRVLILCKCGRRIVKGVCDGCGKPKDACTCEPVERKVIKPPCRSL